MRSEGAYKKRVDETGWHSARREAEAKTRLIEAKVRRVLAEAGRSEAEGRRLDAERVDFEFGVFRKAVFFVIGLAISLVVFAHLLFDPAPLPVDGGISLAALLGWLAKRAGSSD